MTVEHGVGPLEVLSVDRPLASLPGGDQIEQGPAAATTLDLGEKGSLDGESLRAVESREFFECGLHLAVEVDGRLACQISVESRPHLHGLAL